MAEVLDHAHLPALGPEVRLPSVTVTGDQVITDFAELLDLLRGLRGQMVEASAFLPHDEGQYPFVNFAGEVDDLLHRDKLVARDTADRWDLVWKKDGVPKPDQPSITLWPHRFINAELSFTGDAADDFEEIDETRGHNIFLLIRSEGFTIDLTGYV